MNAAGYAKAGPLRLPTESLVSRPPANKHGYTHTRLWADRIPFDVYVKNETAADAHQLSVTLTRTQPADGYVPPVRRAQSYDAYGSRASERIAAREQSRFSAYGPQEDERTWVDSLQAWTEGKWARFKKRRAERRAAINAAKITR